MKCLLILCTLVIRTLLSCQTVHLPYMESFDTLEPPSLPAEWYTSTRRTTAGDFVSAQGGSLSGEIALVSVNSTVEQWLVTPGFDLSDRKDCLLRWAGRRSASHDASVLVEASFDDGASFEPVPGDTLRASGGTEYIVNALPLGKRFDGMNGVRFRWRIAGDGSGSAGTIRFDDVSVEGRARLDMAAGPATVKTPHPRDGEPVKAACPVRNTGYETARGAAVDVFTDLDGDRVAGAGEFHSTFRWDSIPSGDSVECVVTLTPTGEDPGLIFVALLDGDQDRTNDTAYIPVLTGPQPGAVVINEIMYDPLPGHAEYVELLNVTGRETDLRSWRLSDRDNDTTIGRFGENVTVLAPGELMICSPDTSVTADYPGIPPGTITLQGLRGLTLNNSGDMLILTDATGFVIDRVAYLPQWHTPVLDETGGRALERIDPGNTGSEGWNWGSSADPSGGTPGRMNSLSGGRAAPAGDILCSPDPFSPDGDGFEDVTYIHYSKPETSALVRVRIYNTDGWLVRTLTAGTYVPGEGALVWNGFDDEGRKAPIGIYVILLDGVGGSGEDVFSAKGVVVVAAKL